MKPAVKAVMDSLQGRIREFSIDARRIDSGLANLFPEDIDKGTDERGAFNSGTMFAALRPGRLVVLEYNGDIVSFKLDCNYAALSEQVSLSLVVVASCGLDDQSIEVSVLSTEAEFVKCDAVVDMKTRVPGNFDVYGDLDQFLVARVVFRRK